MAKTELPKPGLAANRAQTYRRRAGQASARETINRAWRYSVFVIVMKSALPVAALGLGVAVLSYALQPREQNRVSLTFEQIDKVENDLAMVNPELTGTDDDGLPFRITAKTAVQEERGSDRVRLEEVTARINVKQGGTLHVTAAHGVADTKRHLLDVSGGIHLTSEDGYEVRTEAASADLKAGTVHGETPVEAEGKMGRVNAERFAFNQMTGELRLSGKVHMVLNGVRPNRKEASR